MQKKQLSITIIIVLFIFLLGFFIRFDYIRLPGVAESDKEFYKDQNGLPYMYEFGDSYYHYRLTKNFLEHGYLGDTVINNRYWDLHSYFPPGVPVDYPPMIIYIASFLYRFINLFTSIDLTVLCFWLPVFIGPISGVAIFFFTRKFSNLYGAAAAGILLVTTPLYVVRTFPGFFDTDMFVILFPVIILWLLIESLQNVNIKRQIVYAALSAIFLFLFSISWSGWYYLYYMVSIVFIMFLVWSFLKKLGTFRIIYILITFNAVFFILSILFTRDQNIKQLIYGPATALKFINNNPWAPWPNVYSIVSELSKPSLTSLISGTGLPLFTGIIGVIWIFRLLLNKYLSNQLIDRISWFFYSFLLLLIILSVLISYQGERFILFLVPPLCISSGILIGILIEYLRLLKESGKSKLLNTKKYFDKFIAVSGIIFIAIFCFLYMHQFIINMIPRASEDLWNTATWIKNNTITETIVISNWGNGHLFSAVADRPVSFDGRMGYIENLALRKNDSAFPYGYRSPGIAREYWINKSFTTSNEMASFNILGMLATTGDEAYLTLEDYTGTSAKSAEIINNIIGLSKEKAFESLINNYDLNKKQADKVLCLTHPGSFKPFVLVTTDEIRDKASFIFKFGEWDLYNNTSTDHIYNISDFTIKKDTLTAQNGAEIGKNIHDSQWNNKKPYSVEIISGSKVEKCYIDNKSNFIIIVIMDCNKLVVIDREFENSVFTKLFLEKSGTSFLKPVYRTRTTIVWKNNF